MDISIIQSESPLLISLKYLKNGDIKSSYEVLGLTSEQIRESDFISCMMALEEGLNFLLSGHHTRSIEPLRKAIPLIQITNDQEAKFILPTLSSFAEGISALLQGDAHRAVKLLKLSSDAIQRLNFFIPGMEKLLFSSKAAAELALAKTFINIGDLTQAELIYGTVIQIHQELLSNLDEKNSEDFAAFNEIYGTQIEFSILFMRIDLEALDFDSLDRRIEFTKIKIQKLKQFVDRIPNTPIKGATEILIILFDVFEIYSRIGRRVINDREPADRTGLNDLLEVDRKLFEARQKANNSGDCGKLFLYTINQLYRLRKSYLSIGKIQKKDFGRISGLIALVALISQVIIVHKTINPVGNMAILLFLGELIISLVAGFGYGAIKFKPLLSLYSDIIKTNYAEQKQPKEHI